MLKNATKILLCVLFCLLPSLAEAGGAMYVYPNFRAWNDTTGTPCRSCELYTYAAGTSTEKATYSERTLTTENENPVSLDVNGEAVIYLEDGRYKMVLVDTSGTTLWTRDYQRGIGGSGGFVSIGDYADLDTAISDIGATETTLLIDEQTTLYADATVPVTLELWFTRAGEIVVSENQTLTINGPILADAFKIFDTSASGATVEFTNGQKVFAQWWGAITGDGQNDSTAIQAALTAVGGQTSTLIIPGGTYYIASGLTMDSAFTMIGENASRNTIFQTDQDITALTLTGGADYSVIKNITFQSASDTGTALKFYDAREAVVQGCSFIDWSIGMLLETYDEGTWYNNINDSVFSSNDIGVKFDQAVGGSAKSNRNRFISDTFIGNASYAIYLESGGTNTFVECDIGMGNSPAKGIYAADNSDYWSFINGSIEGGLADTSVCVEVDTDSDNWSMNNSTVGHCIMDIDSSSDSWLKLLREGSVGAGVSVADKELNGPLLLWESGASATAFQTRVTGDADDRFRLRADGRQLVGDGTNPPDVTMYRDAAGNWYIANSLFVGVSDNGWFRLAIQSNVEISSGELTPTGTYQLVDVEGGAAGTDDLDTINGGVTGEILILEAYSGSRDIVLKHGTGNIYLPSGADFTLDSRDDQCVLKYTSQSHWVALSCEDND